MSNATLVPGQTVSIRLTEHGTYTGELERVARIVTLPKRRLARMVAEAHAGNEPRVATQTYWMAQTRLVLAVMVADSYTYFYANER